MGGISGRATDSTIQDALFPSQMVLEDTGDTRDLAYFIIINIKTFACPFFSRPVLLILSFESLFCFYQL